MKTPQVPAMAGMTPLGVKPEKAYVEESTDSANYANPLYIVHFPDSERIFSTMQKSVAQKVADEYTPELFNAEETPFNLAGEQIDNAITEEGEKRVRALAASEARKAQQAFPSLLQSAENQRREALTLYPTGKQIEARAYVRRIKNTDKRAYAENYLAAVLRNEDTNRLPYACSYMGAQSVRLHLATVLGL